jgi:hypothetical protein
MSISKDYYVSTYGGGMVGSYYVIWARGVELVYAVEF